MVCAKLGRDSWWGGEVGEARNQERRATCNHCVDGQRTRRERERSDRAVLGAACTDLTGTTENWTLVRGTPTAQAVAMQGSGVLWQEFGCTRRRWRTNSQRSGGTKRKAQSRNMWEHTNVGPAQTRLIDADGCFLFSPRVGPEANHDKQNTQRCSVLRGCRACTFQKQRIPLCGVVLRHCAKPLVCLVASVVDGTLQTGTPGRFTTSSENSL